MATDRGLRQPLGITRKNLPLVDVQHWEPVGRKAFPSIDLAIDQETSPGSGPSVAASHDGCGVT